MCVILLLLNTISVRTCTAVCHTVTAQHYICTYVHSCMQRRLLPEVCVLLPSVSHCDTSSLEDWPYDGKHVSSVA